MSDDATHPLLTLRAGDLSLVLAPEVGGAVAFLRHGTTDILRPTNRDSLQKGLVRGFACFPLVPYSNRIAHGRFTFEGDTHQLTLNFGDHPHSLHGNAWQRRWTVASASEREAKLTLFHDPFGFGPAGWDGWPFRYEARQHVDLTETVVRFRLEIENRDNRPMPVGLGWHPYFPRREATTLGFSARSVWRNGADALPGEETSVPPQWDFRVPRPLGEATLDNCFAGWDGEAEIGFPQEGLSVRMKGDPACGHLIVYVPEGRDYFAVEPVMHMNDAINRMDRVPGHGLRLLQPGERFTTSFSLAVEAGR